MRRVPLLPEKLGRSQEDPRPHLPADDIGPLVDQHRQIPPRLNPLGIHRADDRLTRRPHHERLLKFSRGDQLAVRPEFQPVMRDHRTLLREALDVLRLLLEVRERDEQGEVGVLMARRLEHPIEDRLHPLPDGEAVGLDHHAAANR